MAVKPSRGRLAVHHGRARVVPQIEPARRLAAVAAGPRVVPPTADQDDVLRSTAMLHT